MFKDICESLTRDLNLIETLWSILDQRYKNRKPANEGELVDRLKEDWKSLPIGMKNLAESARDFRQ
jgi:hypothetical protein